jgi:hypothetical protein
MIITGLIISVSVFVAPQWINRIMPIAIACMALLLVGYSYVAWRQEGGHSAKA